MATTAGGAGASVDAEMGAMPMLQKALMIEWGHLRSYLQTLSFVDTGAQTFASCSPDYLLREPLSQQQLEALEARYRIRLPEDYRAYLTQLSNGGMGPGYGVWPADWVDIDGQDWSQSVLVGSLDKDFRFTQAWHWPPEGFDEALALQPHSPLHESEIAAMEALAGVGLSLRVPSGQVCGKNPYTGDPLVETLSVLIARRLGDRDVMDGAIPVCDHGCGTWDWLVVSGPERGHMWQTTPDNDVIPIERHGLRRLTFGAWFEEWLSPWLQKPSAASLTRLCSAEPAERSNGEKPRK